MPSSDMLYKCATQGTIICVTVAGKKNVLLLFLKSTFYQ